MANTFLTPKMIARQALATLYENMAMLPLVYTDLSQEWRTPRAIGSTVDVRKPAVFVAKEFDRATGIELQDATESSIPVSLNKLADVSFAVTAEQLVLDIQDFDEQLLNPATEAIAQHIDRALIANALATVTQTAGVAAPLWDKPEVLIEAGRLLDSKNVPPTLRHAVVGPATKAKWLDTELLKRVDQSGTNEALRQGSIGRDLFGFDAFMTQNVKPPTGQTGTPSTETSLAFHQTAFAFVSAPLQAAPGADVAVETYKGLSIRVAQQYDIRQKETVVSLDVLYGVKTLDANRAVLLHGANTP